MEPIKYFAFTNSLIVKIDDKNFTVPSSDERYEKLKEALVNKEFAKVPELLNIENSLNDTDFIIKDGVVYFKGQVLPTFFGDSFLKFKKNNMLLSSLANVWFNLKTRMAYSIAQETILKLIQLDGYSATKDGMVIFYKKPFIEKENWTQMIPSSTGVAFYDYSSSKFESCFDQKIILEKVVEEQFGYFSKKLYQIFLSHFLNPTTKTINDSIFNYAVAFNGLLSQENLIELLESQTLLFARFEKEKCQSINDFLNKTARTKDSAINEKKILNIFKKFDSNTFFDCIRMFSYLEEKNAILDQARVRSSSISELHNYFSREIKKIEKPEFDLNIEENFPTIKMMMKALNKQEAAFIKRSKGNQFPKFKLIIPKTNYDLDLWTEKMNQCIHSYANDVKNKVCVVFAVVDGKDPNIMLYNISVFDDKIREFTGRFNHTAETKDRESIEKVLKHWKVVKSSKTKS
jgi:hypothetical protein